MDFGRIILYRRGEQPQPIRLRLGSLSIGSDPTADIVVDEAGVERFHLRIVCTPSGCQLTDLGSQSGTLINRDRISAHTPHMLQDSDRVQFGRVGLIYNAPRAAANAPAEAAPTEAAPPHVTSAEAGPAHVTSAEAAPAEAGPAHVTSAEAAPAEAGPAHVTSAEAAPAEAGPAHVTSAEAAPAEAGPAHVTSAEAAPAEAGPAHVTSAEAGPAHVTSAEAAPAEATPHTVPPTAPRPAASAPPASPAQPAPATPRPPSAPVLNDDWEALFTAPAVSAPSVNGRRLPSNRQRRAPRELPYAAADYLALLPPIYQEDQFLQRFLLIFKATLDPLDRMIGEIHHYFDPRLAPASLLPWLAAWVDLVLDDRWPDARRRELIGAASVLYRWRGTRRGLSDYLRIYTGVTPQIIEQGQERSGEAVLAPHTFRVIIEAPDLDGIERTLVERIINLEKPAHTSYELIMRAAR